MSHPPPRVASCPGYLPLSVWWSLRPWSLRASCAFEGNFTANLVIETTFSVHFTFFPLFSCIFQVKGVKCAAKGFHYQMLLYNPQIGAIAILLSWLMKRKTLRFLQRNGCSCAAKIFHLGEGVRVWGGSFLFVREEKETQTQTFWSGYLRVGWGSST